MNWASMIWRSRRIKQCPKAIAPIHAAELGRADALRKSGKPDAAIEVLEQLARAHIPICRSFIHSWAICCASRMISSGGSAYDRALDLTDDGARSQWFLFYARGIPMNGWTSGPKPRQIFAQRLELNPEQPQVLNYLGYSMVEKQINLDEALDMIERAVAARPDSGYIVDSLGWVLYRLGRYEEAVAIWNGRSSLRRSTRS